MLKPWCGGETEAKGEHENFSVRTRDAPQYVNVTSHKFRSRESHSIRAPSTAAQTCQMGRVATKDKRRRTSALEPDSGIHDDKVPRGAIEEERGGSASKEMGSSGRVGGEGLAAIVEIEFRPPICTDESECGLLLATLFVSPVFPLTSILGGVFHNFQVLGFGHLRREQDGRRRSE